MRLHCPHCHSTIELDAPNHPQKPEMGSRKIPLTREIYIEQEDFMEDAPKKFFRLKPEGEVRLRCAGIIKCDEVVKDAAIEMKCGTEVIKARTDSTGSYRLSARANGKCTISVTHEGQTPSVDVVVFEKPSRYRLVLEKKGDTWTLRRV